MPINAAHPFLACMTAKQKSEFLTKAQNDACLSGDETAMAAADKQALQDALKASLEDAPKVSKAEFQRATGVPVSEVDLRKAQGEITKRAEAQLNRHGLQLVKTRSCAPNCLLVALLQHATGQYAERLSSSLSTKVEQLRHALVEESRQRHQRGERKAAIKTGDRLHADEPLIPWLAKKAFGDDVRVEFYGADADGNAVNFLSVGEGTRSVQIFDCGGSFKAIIPAKRDESARDAQRYV